MPARPQIVLFSERVVNLWNNLDDQSVTASSLNSFKSNLSRLRKQSMGLFMDNSTVFVDPRGCPVSLVGLVWWVIWWVKRYERIITKYLEGGDPPGTVGGCILFCSRAAGCAAVPQLQISRPQTKMQPAMYVLKWSRQNLAQRGRINDTCKQEHIAHECRYCTLKYHNASYCLCIIHGQYLKQIWKGSKLLRCGYGERWRRSAGQQKSATLMFWIESRKIAVSSAR